MNSNTMYARHMDACTGSSYRITDIMVIMNINMIRVQVTTITVSSIYSHECQWLAMSIVCYI